jgi:hypothetical protein
VEWDHELYFRSKAASHLLWNLMPKWPVPLPRESIRTVFGEFVSGAQMPVHVLRIPWLVR